MKGRIFACLRQSSSPACGQFLLHMTLLFGIGLFILNEHIGLTYPWHLTSLLGVIVVTT